jgi:hypothetical protein
MIAEELELVPAGEPERRRSPRPEPPPPGTGPRMRQIVDWHAERIESSALGWVIYAIVCALCVAFICWNMTARFETFDATYELISERAALEREYETLTEHYSRDELRKLLDQISSAETSIFRDYASLASWLAAQAEAARRQNLLLTYVMHETVAAQIKDVGEVPITLSVRPRQGMDEDTYQRILNFLGEMVGTRWHLEITDVVVSADGRSIQSLDTTVHVWVDAVSGGSR